MILIAQQVQQVQSTGFRFDWTISFGNILQLITFLIVLVRLVNNALNKITKRMKAMERRVDMMWAWIFINLSPELIDKYNSWTEQYEKKEAREE